MISIRELRSNPLKRFRLMIGALMLIPGIFLLNTLWEIHNGTASGPFRGKIPLVLNAFALLSFALIGYGVKSEKGQLKR